MKKIFYYTLCLAFCVPAITSCKKSTKGKMVNEWRVKTYKETTPNGIFIMSDSPNEISIKKDGTWTWNREYKSTALLFGGSIYATNASTTQQSGTWSFVGKTKGDVFKKNERVIFNILFEETIDKHTYSPNNAVFQDNTEYTSNTYLVGEKVVIYTVAESTRKELKLTSESSHYNSSQDTVVSKKIELVLEEKK